MRPPRARLVAGPLFAAGVLLGLASIAVTESIVGDLAAAELDLGPFGLGVIGGLAALRFAGLTVSLLLVVLGAGVGAGAIARRSSPRRRRERKPGRRES